MSTKYPSKIDTNVTLPKAIDLVTPVKAAVVNDLIDAILAIENELGVKPSATYATVRSRLDALETNVGNLKIIKLQKDLGGTLDNPLVIGLQGRPIATTAPLPGQVLLWDGLAWIPAPGPAAEVNFGGDLTGNPVTQTVLKIHGTSVPTTSSGDVGKVLSVVSAGVANWQTISTGIRAVASSQPIPSQASEPGWYVIGAFYLSADLNNATVEVIGGVSDSSLTLTVRLFSLGVVAEVANSRVSITSITDVVAISSPPTTLLGGSVYQVQAEAISAFPGDGVWAVVKSVNITI